jgi:hypothetical protein
MANHWKGRREQERVNVYLTEHKKHLLRLWIAHHPGESYQSVLEKLVLEFLEKEYKDKE